MLFEILVLLLGLGIGWLGSLGSKTQFIRLADIFIFGPILIFIGLGYLAPSISIKLLLIFIGAGTISYNLKNYLAHP